MRLRKNDLSEKCVDKPLVQKGQTEVSRILLCTKVQEFCAKWLHITTLQPEYAV